MDNAGDGREKWTGPEFLCLFKGIEKYVIPVLLYLPPWHLSLPRGIFIPSLFYAFYLQGTAKAVAWVAVGTMVNV